MPILIRLVVAGASLLAIVLVPLAPTSALAQSAGASSSGASPSAGSGSTAPSPADPAPSGGVPTGRSALGPETAVEKQEQRKADKQMTICKGC